MPFENDSHVPESEDWASDREDDRAPEPAKKWTRWIPFGIAAVVLIFGIASLIFSMTRRAGESREAEVNALRNTIASEEQQLKTLESDRDDAAEALEKKQKEYDEALEEAKTGLVDDEAAGTKSLETLKTEAADAQKAYSEALEAYDKAVDAVEQTAPGYDEAKTKLEKLQPFLSYATAYQQFMSGAAQELPGMSADDSEAGPDAQVWYTQVVYPAAAQAGFTLPDTAEAFPAAVQALAADPSARVKAYEDALAASKEAEAKLTEANKTQEETLQAYAIAKEAEKTSEDWLNDCEQEIARLEKRVEDLEASIEQTAASLENHREELKKLQD